MTLPIEEALPRLRAELAVHTCVVLQAPPGAGKTTMVPLALLDEPWLKGKSIVMLEPRRLAARAAAGRMSQLRNETVGETVGYRIRFESKTSKATRIEVLTEGILTRRLQTDPALEGVGLVIFDEFHERHLHADLALALCLDSQRGLREDLKILVMSATLDGAAVSRLLNEAPIVSSEGRSYPVDVHYLPRDPEGRLPDVVAQAILHALAEHEGMRQTIADVAWSWAPPAVASPDATCKPLAGIWIGIAYISPRRIEAQTPSRRIVVVAQAGRVIGKRERGLRVFPNVIPRLRHERA